MSTSSTTRLHTPADDVLRSAEVILVVGPGGVGKTTMAAAMAARAALIHDRRALVVTVDPARRLADAMGVDGLTGEPVLVPTEGSGSGELWASMVDMASSWDQLVMRNAPDRRTREALLGNRLYRTLTQRFVQSHDYIALDHLVDLADEGSYDLVIVDTPPSVHALDVLDAPDRMIEFFGSRLLRWLIAPYGNRLVQSAARPFLAVAERLLGGPFLSEITEFFWLFSSLQPTFVERAEAVKARLGDPATSFVIVQTPEPIPQQRADQLSAELERRHHEASLRLINRALPVTLADITADEIAGLADPDLRDAIAALVADAERAPARDDGVARQWVPWTALDLDDLDGLVALLSEHD